VCVFASARGGAGDPAGTAAAELGRLLGSGGYRLVYGGGGAGLMGVVAWSAFRAGAPVVGVMPRFLYEREQAGAAPPQTLRLTATLAERKAEMLRRSDAFVALPGGYGTLDEVFEVLCLAKLARHTKPLVLLDVEGAWAGLTAMLDEIHRRGFADYGLAPVLTTERASDALAALDAVASAVTGGAPC
jgi:uncharacterized protein (TIGR00730 family)